MISMKARNEAIRILEEAVRGGNMNSGNVGTSVLNALRECTEVRGGGWRQINHTLLALLKEKPFIDE